ncbi:hypothetical protein LIER_32702 [Lithospermum erythrorhizon]|uniref:Uncharacterized protein n=1 Tax=Lithospermum erythrorhizon TaxID=34254 RepID=A0AAV3RWU4_LITER
MEYFSQRNGPEETLASVSAPPFHLITILCIVIFLLSFSQYSTYKEQLQQAKINFHFLLLLVPICLVFLMRSSFVSSKFNFQDVRRRSDMSQQHARGFPWGAAVLVMVLTVMVYYQSLIQSKWFGGSY